MTWERIAVEGESTQYTWGNAWLVEATWPRLGKQGPEIEIRIKHRSPTGDVSLVVPTRRVTLTSSSGQDSLLRTVRSFLNEHGEIAGATVQSYVSRVLDDQLDLFKTTGNPKRLDLDLVNRNREGAWLLRPLWPGSGATAIAAGGGSGKSFMAQAVAMSLACGTTFLQRNTSNPQVRSVLYLDFESDEATFVDRAYALARGFGWDTEDMSQFVEHIPYMNLTGHRLQDVVGKIRSFIATHEVDAVVIDSMSASVGEGLIDDATVNAYWDAVARIGVPSLVIVHKSAENVAKRRMRAFGSIMTENRLRMAWNFERTDDDRVLMTCFKDNNTGMAGRTLAYEHKTDSDPESGHAVTSAFWGIDPDTVTFRSDDDGQPVANPTLVALEEAFRGNSDYLTYDEMAERLAIPTGTIKATVSRHKDRFASTKGTDGRVRHRLL